MNKRPLIVFDVNETLLDIEVLEPLFTNIFTTPGRMREWFAQVILYSEALSLAGPYVAFGKLGVAALQMLGQIHGVAVTDDHVWQLGALMTDMPVHADVAAGLAVLKDAGFSIVTLTNSPNSAGPDVLDRAGLGSMFDHRFTVDTVRCFKPTPATYQLVQDTMAAAPDTTWLIAAHAWDTIGAQAFGWKAALVTRGVNAPLVLDGIPQPTLVAHDVGEAARAIAAGR
ncbi:2-haloacid dehalogenase [Sphingomonas sp. BK036]|uniref:haloacid dehalogenase type II n=1 Tax=Sphingomonas sp. BK036 TaxID=2512122 RepID=UPI0010293603|nr:haloacid dehalogenase type II [Sphingomonas sp. BK036]RZT46315.1 2-haloacid dehalogenase [Sphingomonas sp. BK036]